MSEPTPGPYEIAPPSRSSNAAIRSVPSDFFLAEVRGTGLPVSERDANARLLAASWEMREALEQIDALQMKEGADAHVEMGRIAARALAKVRGET